MLIFRHFFFNKLDLLPSDEEIYNALQTNILSENGNNQVLQYILSTVMNSKKGYQHLNRHQNNTSGSNEYCHDEYCWCRSSNWLPGASTRNHIQKMIIIL